MRRLPPLSLVAMLATCMLAARAQDTPARDPHDYPTAERVLYVEACMRTHPELGHYEMLNKCACALDIIASKTTFDDYDTMNTSANAATIGGERGGLFRDTPVIQDKIKQFRKLQADAQKSCMIPSAPAR
ncbi:MAG TPA: hypothetical protein VH328_01295 [Burkholderiaceae bacterium]|jgi:hypothetical protein|nr:hypothetical protein [Burkholderiaceae bacterium]